MVPFPVKGKLISSSRSLCVKVPFLSLFTLRYDTVIFSSVYIFKIVKILNENTLGLAHMVKEGHIGSFQENMLKEKRISHYLSTELLNVPGTSAYATSSTQLFCFPVS